MLLCIGVGNSNIAVGVYAQDVLRHHFRLASRSNTTSDEYAVAIRALLRDADVVAGSITDCAISCVVSSLRGTFSEVGRSLTGKEPTVVSHRTSIGVRLAIDNPAELGPDLIANAVGGFAIFEGACCIVDFGTALSFTAVDSNGDVRGAAIAPGLKVALEALAGSTDALPRVPLEIPDRAIGTNTVHAIQAGLMFGYLGLVESLIGRFERELRGRIGVVATGGLCELIAPHAPRVDRIDPWLTLSGLRIIHSRVGEQRL